MARLKKRILLIDADEDRMGILSYVLTQHGFFVIRSSYDDAARSTFVWGPDVTVARMDDKRMMVNSGPGGHMYGHPMILAANTPPLVLIGYLKDFAATKRGPRKSIQSVPAAAEGLERTA